MLKFSIVLSAVIQTIFLNVQQVDKTAFGNRLYQESDKVLPYRYLLPEGYDAADRITKYPLILILHGSGERGNNNSSQLYDFLSVFQQDNIREKYKAIVVLPQCPANQGFGDTFAEPNLIPWLFSKSLNRFPTSVADREQPELFLYPNPARDIVTLCGLESGETISIIDVKGNIRMTFKAAGETENIPAGGLPQGIYIVKTVKNGKTQTVKLYVN